MDDIHKSNNQSGSDCEPEGGQGGEATGPQPSSHDLQSGNNRKYILTFENSAVTPRTPRLPSFQESTSLDCAVLSKLKCQAFWEFVDSNPKLKDLIKKGDYFRLGNQHEETHRVSQTTKKSPLKLEGVKMPTDKELMKMNLALSEEHKIHKEETRKRLEKRRALNKELIRKSGQPAVVQKLAKYIKPREAILAASLLELPSVYMDEMTVYDDEKIHIPHAETK